MSSHTLDESVESACAKLILFGEHAAVYGEPAIAVPVRGLRLAVRAERASRDSVSVCAGLSSSDQARALKAVLAARRLLGSGPVRLSVSSEIPFKAGFGSSAAFSVAASRAIARLAGSPSKAPAAAAGMEKVFHGRPSGIDAAAVSMEKPVWLANQRHAPFRMRKLRVIVANAGSRPPTSRAVAEVRDRVTAEPDKYLRMIREIGRLTVQAKAALRQGNMDKIALLMDRNQTLLHDLGVSSDRIERIVSVARSQGASAKLSGAGMGGCVIILPRGRLNDSLLDELATVSEGLMRLVIG